MASDKNSSCLFCKIVHGDIPSYRIAENKKFFSFLTIGPHRPGHTLVIPKTHIDDFVDLDDDSLMEIMIFSKGLVNAIKKAFKPKSGKVGLVVAGLEVRHAHLHLIPMDELHDLDIDKGNKNVTSKELQDSQKKILAILK